MPSGSLVGSRAGSPAPSLMSSVDGEYYSHQYVENQDNSQLLSHYEFPGGSAYTRVRLSSAPRSYPTTTADRVASRLAGYLERGSRFDASLAADYFRLLPARISSSAALRDAVALFCTGWGNFRRASPPKAPLVDPRVYGKALRSLQRALSGDDNEGKQLACETLAAASVMDRVEALFGGSRQASECVTHARGIYSLMAARGPPRLDDELDVCLAFGNQITLVSCFISGSRRQAKKLTKQKQTEYNLAQGGDAFYVKPRWNETLTQAANNGTETSRALVDYYFLSVEVGGWANLANEVKRLNQGGATADPVDRASQAAVLWDRLDGHRTTMEGLREGVMAESRRLSVMTEKPNASCPNGVELAWTDIEPASRLLMYAGLSVIVNRLQLVVADAMGGGPYAERVQAENRRLCELVWSCIPQMQRLGPASIAHFGAVLALSLEAGDAAERAHVVETQMKLSSATGVLPADPGKVERLMLSALTQWTDREVQPLLPTDEEIADDLSFTM
ncbi:hypothetical protein HJFPF1_09381 [Paramyrothecium foliicola]|nr:hypothetical protein HJFPF1_09381 [Paramyrothecium foliicola]